MRIVIHINSEEKYNYGLFCTVFNMAPEGTIFFLCARRLIYALLHTSALLKGAILK